MKRNIWLTLGFGALITSSYAWDGALLRLGLKDADIQRIAEQECRKDYLGELPYGTSTARKALKGMTEEERAQAVREVAAVAKALVLSPAFEAAHDEYIKKRYNAVNHGLKIQSQEEKIKAASKNPDAMMADMQRQVGIQMAKSYSQMDAASLKLMFDQDLENWKQSAAATGSDAAKYKKILAKGNSLKALQQSNPEEFRKGYAVLKSSELGGPDNWADLQAGGDAAAKEEQQKNYNQYALHPVLKKKLAEFVKLARSVDYEAQTTTAGVRKFVKPDYERRPNNWKLLFRVGKAPSLAAAQVAEQMMKEL
ncbi:hypothetical protein [Paludibaculum fermentans]|uniref:Uncharacterized protein n=1 Tax=Paludibaculum fermentans TaxID=1473598 RepID=A0A7S7NMM0_PALFE|nr:hypothetical protein [Paludibaculum fermentans]QOY86390.1 hypothetical protein IRI77_26785 [Paludibaculum fermentans]